MPAYCIGSIRIKDREAWEAYRARVGETVVRHGGEVLLRGAFHAVFAGEKPGDAVVAIRFDGLAAAKQWHDSHDYRALVPLRDRGADVVLTLYESEA